jgi:hypothetical protein
MTQAIARVIAPLVDVGPVVNRDQLAAEITGDRQFGCLTPDFRSGLLGGPMVDRRRFRRLRDGHGRQPGRSRHTQPAGAAWTGRPPENGEDMTKPRTMTLVLRVTDDRPSEVVDSAEVTCEMTFNPPIDADENSFLTPFAEMVLNVFGGKVADAE